MEKFSDFILHSSPIKYINATPDGNYALRILQEYRDGCNYRFSDNTWGADCNNPLIIEMNKLQIMRAKELDMAISILMK